MKAEYKIDIPTEWSEVSIGKYVKYIKATNDLDDEDDKIIKTISVLCDPEDIITKIKVRFDCNSKRSSKANKQTSKQRNHQQNKH